MLQEPITAELCLRTEMRILTCRAGLVDIDDRVRDSTIF